MSSRRGAIIPGVLLILFGAWLLAQNFGARLPSLEVLWPGIPLIFGLAFLLQYLFGGRLRQEDGLVFVGVAGVLIGAFFFAFTLGRLQWSDMDRYWPVFVLIGGLAFLAQWLVNPSAHRGLLIPATLAVLVGGGGLLLTLGLAKPELVQQVTKLWPVALILAGLLILISYFFRPKPPPQ